MWWPGVFGNPSLPYFAGAKATAANIPQPGEQGDYTAEMFQADFPQFFNISTPEQGDPVTTPLVPEAMLEMFISQANDSILPSRWGTWWRYAAGLFVAHNATLYLRTYAPSNSTTEQAAASGALVGITKSATLGDARIEYDTTAATQGTETWGDLNLTQYGQILASKAHLVGMGGMYAI